MATTINTPIPSPETPWQNYSGQQVENFIKAQIAEAKGAAAAAVQGVKVNGTPVATDSQGNALIEVAPNTVDASLDAQSANAIANSAVSAKVADIESRLIDSVDLQDNDDGTSTISFYNRQGNKVTQDLTITQGGGDVAEVPRVYVTAALDKARVKEGGTARLTYTFDHRTATGAWDGVMGTITITIKRGTTVRYQETLPPVSNGTYTMDISPYLIAGTVEVTVVAQCTLGDGTVQTRQAYASIYVARMVLTTTFDIAARLVDGGYAQGETITFPYYIEGSGRKTVTVYLDGVQTDSEEKTGSGIFSNFYIPTRSLAPGRHNIQAVAECDGVKSQSLYRDFLIQGATDPYIGCALEFDDGRIYDDTPITPTVDAEQFAPATILFVAWTPESNTSTVDILQADAVQTTVTANRSIQQYTTRYASSGTMRMALRTGNTTYPFYFRVNPGNIEAEETTADRVVSLSATGRSNSEASRDNWGGITTFSGMDWQSSGWATRTVTDAQGNTLYTFEALRLINGARAVIDYRPFATDAKTPNGTTIEMELYISNVADREQPVVECIDGGLGFQVLPREARFHTGGTKQVPTAETDDQGNPIVRTRPIGVAMDLAPDMPLKVAFVVNNEGTGHRLMELYINGILSKVDQYPANTFFIQQSPQPITIDSAHADIDIRSIRIYTRALTENELLNNYIVDRPSPAAITEAYDRNDVADDNGNVSLQKVIAKGRGAMVIIPQSQVDAANSRNNKSADFAADKVYWYSPFGSQYNFVAEHVVFRIQGTSSTKYPRKNYRLYLAKTASGHDITETTLTVGGATVDPKISGGKIKGNKYALRPGGTAMNLFCMKVDYSDSSMTMNTGGAKLFNDIMIQLGLLTPPQQYQLENGGTISVRQAIDGLPCDLFVQAEEGGELTYYGQYNLNNEKSKSAKLFGMEDDGDFTPACPIALEALNNSNPFCLFQSAGTASGAALEQQLQQQFDSGFEFNVPEDVYYNADKAEQEGGTVATEEQKAAIKRLMGWLYDVTPAAMRTNPDYGSHDGTAWDSSKWLSERFRTEAAQYFDVQHLCTYYLFTEYWGSVDQRAKNILWRTWDGLIWYATFYDGDTAMSMRNDGFMAYAYDMTRDTWDEEGNKYAYEGHDSRLWCLVLANLGTELKAAADALRSKLTTAVQLAMFNDTQMRNWSERQYNQSGRFKYVKPLVEGVYVENQQGNAERTTYDYLYALTGSREAHRTAFLTNRAALLDAIYDTSAFREDRIAFYISKADTTAQPIRITSTELCYYGYRRNNGGFMDGPTLATAGQTVSLVCDEVVQLNDPLNLCGASRIAALDWTAGPTLRGNFEMNKCAKLQSLNLSAANGGTQHLAPTLVGIGNCTMLHTIDITGQAGLSTGNSALDLANLTRLATLRAGGTGLQQVTLAEGAPIATLVLPDTIQYLSLRYLPQLTMDGLTMEGTANVRYFNFTTCPGLDWQRLLALCDNVEYIRVEGITGRLDPDILRQYQGYKGIDENGQIDTQRPRLVGEVTLTSVVTDAELSAFRASYPELTITPAQFSEYIFHDLEADPANVTNMDNRTGYAFTPGDNSDTYRPNGYLASGHLALLHELAQPVRARFTKAAGDTEYHMVTEPMSKTDFSKMADGTDAELDDAGQMMYDFFLLLPRYHYKGVNYYRRATKHLFISTLESPRPSYTLRLKMTLAEIQAFDPTQPLSPSSPLTPFAPLTPSYHGGSSVVTADQATGQPITLNANATSYDTYRLPVLGMRLVRFPHLASQSIGSAFTTADGKVIATNNLKPITTPTSSPLIPSDPSTPLPPGCPQPQNATAENALDINPDTINGYDILAVPDGAAYIYFTTPATAPADAPAIATDSDQIESLEEWVEHRPELIGLWQATKDTSGNIRSRSPKTTEENAYTTALRGNGTNTTSGEWQYDTDGNIDLAQQAGSADPTMPVAPPATLNYTAADLLNLCQLRGQGYHAISYETAKDLANIFMAWLGTRSIEDLIGRGGNSGYNPGYYRRQFNYGESLGQTAYNNIWGIESFTGAVNEVMDGICANAPTYRAFLRARRSGTYTTDQIYRIRERYGETAERSVPATPSAAPDYYVPQRLAFGQRCDIIMSAARGEASPETHADHYAARQSLVNAAYRTVYRACSSGYTQGGVAFLSPTTASTANITNTTRLCYTYPATSP